MAGYFVHLASCDLLARHCRSFVIGVEAPDLLKKYFELYGMDGAREKYNSLKTPTMPEFEVFEERILQKEHLGSKEGLHYGINGSSDVRKMWENLSEKEQCNPFWRGYTWHLITDRKVHGRLAIEKKFEMFRQRYVCADNTKELEEEAMKLLHLDWDKTNLKIKETYPDVCLTPEVEELGVVQFKEGDLHFVDWEILKETIDFLRSFDPLSGDFDIEIIL